MRLLLLLVGTLLVGGHAKDDPSKRHLLEEANPTTQFRWDDGRTYTQLTDWGKSCRANSDCESGICSTSCSSYDINPFTSTSCMCPCPDGGGPCCCGCVMNGGPAVEDGLAAVTTCPQYGEGWARGDLCDSSGNASSSCSWGQRESTLDEIPCNFTYARLGHQGILDDAFVTPEEVEFTVNYTGPSKKEATKKYGDQCETADECSSGICGVGCNCPSELSAVCSCQVPCNFPTKCCGGCFIDQNPAETTCPVADAGAETMVTVTTFDGPSTWLPNNNQDISYNLCLLYNYTMSGVDAPDVCNKFVGSIPDPPQTEDGTPAYEWEQVFQALCQEPPEKLIEDTKSAATTTWSSLAAAFVPLVVSAIM